MHEALLQIDLGERVMKSKSASASWDAGGESTYDIYLIVLSQFKVDGLSDIVGVTVGRDENIHNNQMNVSAFE